MRPPCQVSGRTQATKESDRANSLSECWSTWPIRSTSRWPHVDISKRSSVAGAVALLQRVTSSSPDPVLDDGDGLCRDYAAQSAPLSESATPSVLPGRRAIHLCGSTSPGDLHSVHV